jgi:hypothetical protein
VEILVVLGAAVLILAFLLAYPAWLKAQTRKKRLGDPSYSPPRLMGIVDELYHPDAHATRQIVEDERVIPAKAPLPGDKSR